ncbi:metal-dependent transcriptional regulator [Clostridium algidicarnis]|uniref:metal-dependent transcriptional regulator n=1 Tax=Clostridium algidicarnis TaxID=37659 RepID=UPI001C0E2FD2|nr:DtxR family transcriptional regulator [Clostridium algidicarnis]MBU3227304.1 DtxR family transcriptional regulator [Clostridium algidicarnis]MBU3250827.1 DtxR family transcriptional regulator [Clostridium algidicarnis]
MTDEFHTVRGYELKREGKDMMTPALEDYLEMIYRNSMNEDYIRINTLAKLLNVKDSSASKMVKRLGELKLVNYEKYGIVTLTKEGKKLGEFLLNRHNVIEDFLSLIGCKDDILLQAELIEHTITPDTVYNIKNLNIFFENNKDILEKYTNYKRNIMEGSLSLK